MQITQILDRKEDRNDYDTTKRLRDPNREETQMYHDSLDGVIDILRYTFCAPRQYPNEN